jgi:hypothetical protein
VRSGYYRAISMLKASYRAGLTAARDWVDMERASLTDAMRHAAPFSSGRLVDVGCGEKPHEALAWSTRTRSRKMIARDVHRPI